MRVARYHRVSTDDQDHERQVQATDEYVNSTWPDADARSFADISTGTDTERGDYQELMERVDDGEFDAVVVKSISRVARSIRDLDRTVERLRDGGCALHIIDESLRLEPNDDDPMQRAMWQLMGVFAELEAQMTRKRIKEGIAARRESEDYHHGPAPLGFVKDGGSLVEASEYDKVCAVLDMVQAGELSKRKAAKRLDTSRKTINRSLDRGQLYGL